jgi:hypothetical protein
VYNGSEIKNCRNVEDRLLMVDGEMVVVYYVSRWQFGLDLTLN